MKKLMCAVAAIAAGVAMADEIQSANVVGYNQQEMTTTGAKGAGATFVPVAGGSVNLQDIAITGYDGEAWGEVEAQLLTGGGTTDDAFKYFDCDVDDGENPVWHAKGWYYLADSGLPTPLGKTVMLAPGEGLWTFGTSEYESKMQSSGAVANEDISIALPSAGAKLCVNATAANISLNAGEKSNWKGIYVTGYSEEAWGEVEAQILTGGGTTDDAFKFFDCEVDDGENPVWHAYGWYYLGDSGLPVELGKDVKLNPGEALWVFGTGEYGATFNFANALN